MKLNSPEDILRLIAADAWRMQALRVVAGLNLPDWWIGAGFVRNCAWDCLHNYSERTPLSDLDVIYFSRIPADSTSAGGACDADLIERQLLQSTPEYNWEVTDQAVVHISNQQAPYLNSVDSLSRWTESATCVAVTLRSGDHATRVPGACASLQVNDKEWLFLAAPHGIEDLVNLIVCPTPHPESKRHVFEDRIRTRNWFEKWPKLKVVRE